VYGVEHVIVNFTSFFPQGLSIVVKFLEKD
jgi:hypothetical protein